MYVDYYYYYYVSIVPSVEGNYFKIILKEMLKTSRTPYKKE